MKGKNILVSNYFSCHKKQDDMKKKSALNKPATSVLLLAFAGLLEASVSEAECTTWHNHYSGCDYTSRVCFTTSC